MSSPDPYQPPSYKGAIAVAVVSLVVVVIVWVSFANALDSDWAKEMFGPGAPTTSEPRIP